MVAAAAMVTVGVMAASLAYGMLALVTVNQGTRHRAFRIAIAPAEPRVPEYLVTPLGKRLSGPAPYVGYIRDLNNNGCVVGSAVFSDNPGSCSQGQVFTWTRTTGMRPVSEISEHIGGVIGAWPEEINDAGLIVGKAYVKTVDGDCLAVTLNAKDVAAVWQPQGDTYATTLIPPVSNFTRSYATAVNQGGDLTVEFSRFSGGRWSIWAFVRRPNQPLQDLTVLAGRTILTHAINDRGQVAGDMGDHAFLWSGAHDFIDLGTFGGCCSNATALNNQGDVVGYAFTGIADHAFLYHDGVLRDLGVLPDFTYASQAADINDDGQVVGLSATPGFNNVHAFRYEPTRGVQDLNELIAVDSGWVLEEPTAINNRGQIVGHGRLNDERYAFLLDPLFTRGDCNADGHVDLFDAVAILHYLFLGEPVLFTAACDANDDGTGEITDVVYLLRYLFLQDGTPPPPPFLSPGVDPTLPSPACS